MSASRIAPESYSPATATGEKNTLREEGDVGAGEEARTLDLKLGKLDGAHVLHCSGGDNGVAPPPPPTSPDAAEGPSCAAELQPSYSAKKPDIESLSRLAKALRKEADHEDLSRAASEAILVLARLLEGRTLYYAFGSPGDWGYHTRIGEAVAALYSTTWPAPHRLCLAEELITHKAVQP